jgi:hypothetical protein
MAQLIIDIDDEIVEEYGLEEIEKLLKDFIKSKEDKFYKNTSKTKEQQEFIDDLKQSLHEVELYQQGKIKLPTFQEMLNEL